MNGNLFAPIEGEGANGKPVVIPPRELLKMQQQFQINRFNLLASDRMPLNRSLPDYRKKMFVSLITPSTPFNSSWISSILQVRDQEISE